MTDKMIRIAGRDQSGLAKPIKTDENGNINVLISGKNIQDNSVVNGVSYELDQNNFPVIRVVDAAPFAYDIDSNSLQTRVINTPNIMIKGSSERTPLAVQQQTIANNTDLIIDEIDIDLTPYKEVLYMFNMARANRNIEIKWISSRAADFSGDNQMQIWKEAINLDTLAPTGDNILDKRSSAFDAYRSGITTIKLPLVARYNRLVISNVSGSSVSLRYGTRMGLF